MDFDKKQESVIKQINKWTADFSKSLFYKQLSSVQKEEAPWIIERYADFMFSYFNRLPGKWTQKDTVEVVGYYFPRKISLDSDFFSCVVPVLKKFFQYLSEGNLIKNGDTLIRGLDKSEEELMSNVENSDSWGIAKQFAMAAEKAGFNLSNQDELDAFAALWNMQKLAQQNSGNEMKREPIRVKKIGRNEPCPCGSGKKYKKCHGRNT